MSDTGRGKREWRFYVDDMISFAEKVQTYTAALNQSGFVADELRYDATLRNLELIDDLLRQTQEQEEAAKLRQADLFADFNGLPDDFAKTEFYQHDANWSNRMILGDSLQLMASLAEREGLRGKVQCIYVDPPYGIKFNSNFQWSTTSSDVTDGKAEHITREPEQVKAFRDTWRDGIHSYLTYLRDRLTVARDLLSETGSVFVQIGEENVHRIRGLMDEIFSEDNFISQISYVTTGGLASETLSRTGDYLVWYAKKKEVVKYRDIVQPKKSPEDDAKSKYDQFETSGLRRSTLAHAKTTFSDSELENGRIFRIDNIISQGSSENTIRKFSFRGQVFDCGDRHHWKTNPRTGMLRLGKADRISVSSRGKLGYVRYFNDYSITRPRRVSCPQQPRFKGVAYHLFRCLGKCVANKAETVDQQQAAYC